VHNALSLLVSDRHEAKLHWGWLGTLQYTIRGLKVQPLIPITAVHSHLKSFGVQCLWGDQHGNAATTGDNRNWKDP
jgi:hypothetical protein